MYVKIEDAEEERSSVEVIKSVDGVMTIGFGNDEPGFSSAAVTFTEQLLMSSLCV